MSDVRYAYRMPKAGARLLFLKVQGTKPLSKRAGECLGAAEGELMGHAGAEMDKDGQLVLLGSEAWKAQEIAQGELTKDALLGVKLALVSVLTGKQGDMPTHFDRTGLLRLSACIGPNDGTFRRLIEKDAPLPAGDAKDEELEGM